MRHQFRLTLVLIFSVLSSLLQSTSIAAAPGDLDSTFGTGGKVTTDFGPLTDIATSISQQPDGNLLAAGSYQISGTNTDFAIARYTLDGKLDPTFGTGGKVTTDFAGHRDTANAVLTQACGRIIVAGYSEDTRFSNRFAIAGYTPAGKPDLTFGSSGAVFTTFETTQVGASPALLYSLAAAPDGKLVAAGYAALANKGNKIAVSRYSLDGVIDPTFGTGGIVTAALTSPVSAFDQAHAVAVQADGKVVVAGCANCVTNSSAIAVVRFNTDGSLDGGFGTGGKVITPIGQNDSAEAVLVQPGDGKIVVAGGSGTKNLILVRYLPDGTLDPGFGTGGKVATTFVSGDVGHGLAIQADGKVIVGGCSRCGAVNGAYIVARYGTDGTLDSSFGNGGKLSTTFNSASDLGLGVLLQSSGSIVLAGVASFASVNSLFGLVRYQNDGSAPPSTVAACPKFKDFVPMAVQSFTGF